MDGKFEYLFEKSFGLRNFEFRDYEEEKWVQGEEYEGQLLERSLHGEGVYRWRNSHFYEGGFYSNFKEGYGVVSIPDNSYFEGLFVGNRPFGPGILTHSNGRQDAGFWLGRKLVRLGRSVDFIVPRLAPTSASKIKLLQYRRLIPLNEVEITENSEATTKVPSKCQRPSNLSTTPYSKVIYDPRSFLFDKDEFEKRFFENANDSAKERRMSSEGFDEIEDGQVGSHVVSKDGEEVASMATSLGHCFCAQDVFQMVYTDEEEDRDICEKIETSGEKEMGLLGYYTRYGTLQEILESSSKSLDNRFPYTKRKRSVKGDEEEEEEREGEEEEEEDGDEGEEGEVEGEEDERGEGRERGKGGPEGAFPPRIISWNRGELCTEMLKQIFRYRNFEEKVNFDIGKLMSGGRNEFRKTGEQERQCLQFLRMCAVGPRQVVKELLCSAEISEHLMDARGNNSLMFAAAADQHDIINLLLDYGVDVNSFNDESLTPLNLCLLRRLSYTYGISNWETAFLPPESPSHQSVGGDSGNEEWRTRESIPSLDRIFGDGMSIYDTDAFFVEDDQPPVKHCSSDSQRANKVSWPTSFPSGQLKNFRGEFPECNYSTSRVLVKIVPKSLKTDEFERSIRKTSKDRYIFELSPVKNYTLENYKKLDKEYLQSIGEEIGEQGGDEEESSEDKIKEIDKTIEMLLRRGADPNISEAPKPSIHLGIFTKSTNIVHSLLLYGAKPDSRLYANEGLLTPLHVVALLRASPEHVDICRMLLQFGADPEAETFPEFLIDKEKRLLMDPPGGRTPLQLLCSRPDLEYADPYGYILQIALMLVAAGDKRRLYHGHSYLTLAMLSGHIKLIEAFLNSGYSDPNDILGNELGTALHVLVSTFFQRATDFETSRKMCDLLIEAGADVLKELKTSKKLEGTCIDYGYREIQREKARREGEFNGKDMQKSKENKNGIRDHLNDHIRLVEYLSTSYGINQITEVTPINLNDQYLKEKSEEKPWKKDEEGGYIRRSKEKKESKVSSTDMERKMTRFRTSLLYVPLKKDSSSKDLAEKEEREREMKKKKEGGEDDEVMRERKKRGKKGKEGGKDEDEEEMKKRKERGKKGKGEGKDEKEEQLGKKKKRQTKWKEGGEDEKDEEIRKTRKERGKKRKEEEKRDENEEETGGRRRGRREKRREEGKVEEKGKSRKEFPEEKEEEKKKKKTTTRTNKGIKWGHEGREVKGGSVQWGGSRRGRKSIAIRHEKSLPRKAYNEYPDTFPEKLRQSLLRRFGNCRSLDVNKLFLPYVVLRDGNLYYRFQGKPTATKEQYSLI